MEKKESQKNKEDVSEDQKNTDQLISKDSLERFARENYGHKKENETIFYIEIEDSLNL